MKSVCVFCGSLTGRGEIYRSAARRFGEEMARRGLTLVYGGGKVGLMGVVADAVMAHGGRVIGVIPRFLLEREVGHGGVTELVVVESMHERKALMSELADGFVALPGGFGTLEELAEVTTWAQLGLHRKPIGLLNVAGFFDDSARLAYGTVDGAGRVIFGGGTTAAYGYQYGNATRFEARPDDAGARAVRANLDRYFPELAEIPTAHRWSGPLDLTLVRHCAIGVMTSSSWPGASQPSSVSMTFLDQCLTTSSTTIGLATSVSFATCFEAMRPSGSCHNGAFLRLQLRAAATPSSSAERSTWMFRTKSKKSGSWHSSSILIWRCCWNAPVEISPRPPALPAWTAPI